MTGSARPPWPQEEPFPRYSAAEYARRWSELRALLREAGASAAVVAGHAAGRAEVQFLTNAPVRWESLLIFPLEGEPRLLVQLDNHAAGLAEWSIVPVEPVGPDLASAAARRLEGLGPADLPVGLLGPVSRRLAGALEGHLGEGRFVSLAEGFTKRRLVKSSEELTWTSYGAALCDAAVEAFVTAARPGMREDELGAALESAVLRAGGQTGICFLATADMNEGGAVVPRQTWSRRRTSASDLVMFELSAGFGGATGQVLRTVSLGMPATAAVRRLHDVADEVFRELLEAVRPDLPVVELERIGTRIDAAGLTIVDDLVHGYGGGYLPPHIRTPATRRSEPGDLLLREGMLLVAQPNVVSADHRHGVQTGELLAVTATGARSLHAAPRGLLHIS